MEALQRSDSTTAVSRLGRTLHHYLVRMSSRPTPYGLFACRTRRPGQAHRCTNRGDESRHTNPPGYEMTVGTDIRIGQRRAHAGTRHTWPTPNSLSGPADGSILRESPATSTQTAARPFQCATTLVRLAVQGPQHYSPCRPRRQTKGRVDRPTDKVEGLDGQLWARQILLTGLRPRGSTATLHGTWRIS